MAANYIAGVLWLLLMFYIMLFCQHRICEAYFVPALNVLMDKMGNSKNPWLKRLGDPGVAGATFMALGANGPELFTNLFALYMHNDGGIGVVIGSEIFNLLVIIGASICSAPLMGGPLPLDKSSFTRDVIWYAISIALLVHALQDKVISKTEAWVMLSAGLCYWICVYFTDDIGKLLGSEKGATLGKDQKRATVHGVVVGVETVYHSRMADGHGGHENAMQINMDNPGEYMLAEPADEPEVLPGAKAMGRGSVGFNLPGGMLPKMMYKDLSSVVLQAENVFEMTFESGAFQRFTLKVTCDNSSDRDSLIDNLQKCSGAEVQRGYDASPSAALKHLKHEFAHGGCLVKIHAVLEVFVDVLLRTTLSWCDVKDAKKEGCWPVLFVCAMFWLAAFSGCMVYVMGEIADTIPELTSLLLGVTLGAIGTSLPNAMGSVMMAKQGKSAAAIGNAFGSNVQNVFLAMAGPWIIYILSVGGDGIASETDPNKCHCVKMNSPSPEGLHGQSVSEGVAWMLGTLVLVVFFALMPQTCTFNKCAGYIFLGVYVCYLSWTVYEFNFWKVDNTASASATMVF